MNNTLGPEENHLLNAMQNGTDVILRATTGRATYFGKNGGEYDCTNALIRLVNLGLVEITKLDQDAGWAWYGPKKEDEK